MLVSSITKYGSCTKSVSAVTERLESKNDMQVDTQIDTQTVHTKHYAADHSIWAHKNEKYGIHNDLSGTIPLDRAE